MNLPIEKSKEHKFRSREQQKLNTKEQQITNRGTNYEHPKTIEKNSMEQNVGKIGKKLPNVEQKYE
jgi:hypothetical protein